MLRQSQRVFWAVCGRGTELEGWWPLFKFIEGIFMKITSIAKRY
jgi:hypothetical protein